MKIKTVLSVKQLRAGIFFACLLFFDCLAGKELPVALITVEKEGCSSQDMERLITVPIERALYRLKIKCRSISSSGKTVITIFAEGQNDSLRNQLRACLSAAELPEGTIPELKRYTDPARTMRYILQGDRYTSSELRKINETRLADEYNKLPDVQNTITVGGGEEVILICPDIVRLEKYRLVLSDLSDAIDKVVLYGINSKVLTAEEISNIRISNKEGETILIKDLAQVSLKAEPGNAVVGNGLYNDVVEGIVVFGEKVQEDEKQDLFFSVFKKIKQEPLPTGIILKPFQVDPPEEQNTLVLNVCFPAGTSLQKKTAFAEKIRTLILSYPGVITVVSEMGFSFNDNCIEENQITFFIDLKEERELRNIIIPLKVKLYVYPEINYSFTLTEEAERPKRFCIKIFSEEKDEFFLKTIRKTLASMEDTYEINTIGQDVVPETVYEVDRSRMAGYGVSVEDLQKTVLLISTGKTWSLQNSKVQLKLSAEQANDHGRHQLVKSSGGNIPLYNLVSIKIQATPFAILRENGKRYTEIDFSVIKESALDKLRTILNEGVKIPPGCALVIEKK